jgi:hypothetical protein
MMEFEIPFGWNFQWKYNDFCFFVRMFGGGSVYVRGEENSFLSIAAGASFIKGMRFSNL